MYASIFSYLFSSFLVLIVDIHRCGGAVDSLLVEFGKGNIKLTRCPKCASIADKYIEFELILVILDIVLHRKQAFRHVLFNRPSANFENVNVSEDNKHDFRILFAIESKLL